MPESLLFSSVHDPVPPVRQDLQLLPLQQDGVNVLYVHDALGYVPANFALNSMVEPILSLINGKSSIQDIFNLVQGAVDRHNLLQFIQLLDDNCILESENHKEIARQTENTFESGFVRPAALSGLSYPSVPGRLDCYLNEILDLNKLSSAAVRPKKGLYAPHIDLGIGKQVYADAFSLIREQSPRRVVILATAHYSSYYADLYGNRPFIGSQKTFQLPNGPVSTDAGYLRKLALAGEEIGYTQQDRAHRIEHSIELHLLFARHIWKHDFRIVPILTASFEELFYMQNGHLANQLENFITLLRELDDDDTFYLISGDLAHVGKKFGDPVPAAEMRGDVEQFDEHFIHAAAAGDSGGLFAQIQKKQDPYRICGFPPLYTFLNLFPGLKGEKISYQWWDEPERESAVSFGAIGY